MSTLNARQELYLDWLCSAPSERTPSSKRAFAELHGTTTQTLRNWEKNPAFREVWKGRVDEIQGSPERTQRLLDSLFEKGMGGDTKAASLWLQTTGRLQPQTVKVETSARPAMELSDDELRQLIAVQAGRQLADRESPLGVVS